MLQWQMLWRQMLLNLTPNSNPNHSQTLTLTLISLGYFETA